MTAKPILVALSLLLHPAIHADSSCWPEELLIGTRATGYIVGVNDQHKVFGKAMQTYALNPDDAPPGGCEVAIHATAGSGPARMVDCRAIACIKGDCGDAGEHTMLPVEDWRGHFVRVRLKQGSAAWLKLAERPEVWPLMAVGRVGHLTPRATLVLDAPRGRPLARQPDEDTAYVARRIVAVGAQQWVQVDMVPVLSGEPPVETGKPFGQGYFLHRDKGRLQAALSEIYCD